MPFRVRSLFVLSSCVLVACAGILGLEDPSFVGSATPNGDGGNNGDGAVVDGGADANLGCGPRGPQRLADGAGQVQDIAVDDGFVYFTSFDKHLLGRVDKECKGRIDLLPEGGVELPTGLRVHRDHVYWTAYGPGEFKDSRNGVRRMLKDGGGVESLDRCNTALDLEVDDQFVLAVTDVCGGPARVRRFPKDDRDAGFVDSFVDNEGKNEYGYAKFGWTGQDATSVYWASAKLIRSLPKEFLPDAAPSVFGASATDDLLAIGVDDRVYVLTKAELLAFSKNGLTKPDTLVGDLGADDGKGGRAALALDATHVYFTQPERGVVGRVPRTGAKEVEVIVKDQAFPSGIALDAEWVYWSNAGDGTVWRTPK